MEKVKVKITGIEREEYMEALHNEAYRFYWMLFVVILIVCGAIILATGNTSVKSVCAPIVIYFVVVIAAEILVRHQYKDQLKVIDNLSYEFSDKSWKVIVGEEENEIEWKKTPKLMKKKLGLYVFNSDNTSSLIPLRFLNEEEIAQIFEWYNATREDAKKYQKMLDEQSRQRMHDNMMNSNKRLFGGSSSGFFGKK